MYAADVMSGRIVVGRKIKLAVERFYKWIEDAEQQGYNLDHKAGMQMIKFFPTALKHTKGKGIAGNPFVLAPFQQFTMYNLFGWKDSEGKRRINTVYDKRAKKNGKTAEMAGMALGVMALDNESTGEVYVGATKRDQAKLCWKQAVDFIQHPQHASIFLKGLGFRCMQSKILFTPNGSKMQPLGADRNTEDGIASSLSIIDEYHAHLSDGLKENLESSSVLRWQPITYHITTAGIYVNGVCKNYEDTCIEVLEGRKVDDHLWVMIHDLDEGDDWEDETVWCKANPLMGQGLDIEAIRKEYIKAKNQISKAPNFKTKHLNMWVDAQNTWIPQEIWGKCKVDKIPDNAFAKAGSITGLDLSSTTDLTAYVHLSEPDEDAVRYLKPQFFMPNDNIDARSKQDRVPYRAWADAGYITATPGNTIDYTYIKDYILDTYWDYNVQSVQVDDWNSDNIVQQLEEQGVVCKRFMQGIRSISFPTKQFEKLVYDGLLKHDGNPVLSWMLAGVFIYRDPNDNIKPHKGHSNRRIDGVVATIMALGGSLAIEKNKKDGKYSKPGADIYV